MMDGALRKAIKAVVCQHLPKPAEDRALLDLAKAKRIGSHEVLGERDRITRAPRHKPAENYIKAGHLRR